jgi:SnoaL-like domain
MTAQSLWDLYAACWSAPSTRRREQLDACVTSDVVYRDPNAVVTGVEALSAYMEGFGNAFPGERFAIDRVDEHHSRSLSHWRQLLADGSERQHGASMALAGQDGRLVEITGFFLGVARRDAP